VRASASAAGFEVKVDKVDASIRKNIGMGFAGGGIKPRRRDSNILKDKRIWISNPKFLPFEGRWRALARRRGVTNSGKATKIRDTS
jgi:hypothetical protein